MTDYQVMPPLSDAEYAELKRSIKARGVLVPVEYDENGEVLDGYHRVRACHELGITDWPRVVRRGLSETGKRAHARRINLQRRHLDRVQKIMVINAQIKDTPERSDRAIAADIGVDHKTVGAARAEMESTGEIPQLGARTGGDGKTRPVPDKREPTRRKLDPVEDAIKRDPLAIIWRAWNALEPNERAIFMSRIGATQNPGGLIDGHSNRLTFVAYHEAGHAVIALRLGYDVTKATIERRNSSEGHVEIKKVEDESDNIRIDMAGPIAEALVNPLPLDDKLRLGARSDWKSARRSAWALAKGDRRQTDILIDRLCQETRALVHEHQVAIKHVAEALLKRQTLTGDEIKALMENTRAD